MKSAEPVEAVMETLISRGWRFRDHPPGDVLALIHGNASVSSSSLDSVESELLNMDLRSFGGKSIPDASAIKKSSHLQGPKILQLVSARDISRSIIDASFKNPNHERRLLRLILTDGHSEVTAVEYAHIPAITEEMVPGTKVRLENKIVIHNGILCLNPKVVSIMGGLVQSLYEEWQMSQKYSGFSRSALRPSQNGDGVGPPPFEKLQIGASRPGPSFKVYSGMGTKVDDGQVQQIDRYQVGNRGGHSNNPDVDKVVIDSKIGSAARKVEDKPSSSEARPKEVSEAVPVQNQAAAQKLLQKMNQPALEGRYHRGQKQRFRDKQEEEPVFTLDEWEKRKGNNLKPAGVGNVKDISHDEELARQLQNQLDLEDFHGRTEHAEAEQIRMNMFSFSGTEERRNDGGRGFRGRGRGRGRGRRRFG